MVDDRERQDVSSMNYSITYVLEKKNNRPGEMRLRVRVRWDGKLAQFYIPYSINPEKWSKDTNRCTANSSHGKQRISASVINSEIQKYEDAVKKVLTSNLTKEEFEQRFNKELGKKPKNNPKNLFFDVFDEFTNTVGLANSWSKSTYNKFRSIKNHLKNFDEKISFDNITEDTLIKFILYLQSPKAKELSNKDDTLGFKNSTTYKHLAFVKWFLRWSSTKGYYNGNLHQTFKPKLKGSDGGKDVIYLTWDELIKLYNFKFKEKSLEQVRDVFCFCCFTSLRYSDVAKLKRSDIRNNYILIVTQKTSDPLKIELNDYSKEILDKYKEETFEDDLALPVISNQKMNKHLKTMGEKADIKEPIRVVYFIGSHRHEEVYPKYELLTTHCGRRTFIVNALYLGIPAEVVMSWTGHSDYKAMRPYIAIVDDLKVSSMKKFNKK